MAKKPTGGPKPKPPKRMRRRAKATEGLRERALEERLRKQGWRPSQAGERDAEGRVIEPGDLIIESFGDEMLTYTVTERPHRDTKTPAKQRARRRGKKK